jgi:hypothetical protein
MEEKARIFLYHGKSAGPFLVLWCFFHLSWDEIEIYNRPQGFDLCFVFVWHVKHPHTCLEQVQRRAVLKIWKVEEKIRYVSESSYARVHA